MISLAFGQIFTMLVKDKSENVELPGTILLLPHVHHFIRRQMTPGPIIRPFAGANVCTQRL